MQPLLANSTTLAIDWGGDTVWQGLWIGSTVQSVLISTIVAAGVCWSFLNSRVGLLAAAVLGVIGNYLFVHVFQNHGDAVWQELGKGDGLTFFLCIVGAGFVKAFSKASWGGVAAGLAVALFIYLFVIHWALIWVNSLGGFSFSI